MLREIITPADNHFTIHFPSDFIGKRIEVIAFPIDESEETHLKPTKNDDIDLFYASFKVNNRDFKFDRLEANNFTSDDWK